MSEDTLIKIAGGMLIIFDGIDGVGKSTQISHIRQSLLDEGWPVYVSRNLGGSPIGERLREVLLDPLDRPPSTDLYVSVAIQEALLPVIAAERVAGKIILMDRGPLSLAAYQIYGSGVDPSSGWQYVQQGMVGLNPDLTIIYEADTQVAIERARQHSKKADYFETKPIEYFNRVAKGFREARGRYPLQFINADRPIEDVQADTWKLVEQALAKKK